MDNGRTIEDVISGHIARNASLRNVFLQKNVDLGEPRIIECHFWTWSGADAVRLAEALRAKGFEILAQVPAAKDSKRWNLEAAVKQSIELTMRREFVSELVYLAASNGGLYDGWGTRI